MGDKIKDIKQCQLDYYFFIEYLYYYFYFI